MINRLIFAVACILLLLLIIFGIRSLFKLSRGTAGVADARIDERENEPVLNGEAGNDAINDESLMNAEATVDNADSAAADDTGNDENAQENENILDGVQTASSDEINTITWEDVPTPSAHELAFFESESTSYMASEEMTSTYGILTNVTNHSIVATKNSKDRISPASMTKILTLLVAAENLTEEKLEENVTITIEDTDFAYANDCSSVGFAEDETVKVVDLLYGTILPSGGDAAYALSKYIAGSHEAFVDMMNEKLSELGVSESAHFTNCVGLYDDNHYCSAYDVAIILEAAMANPLCRQVLSAHHYTTTPTKQHPDGIEISNLFLRRIEDKDTKGEVIGAKTGYVVQSGNCAASYYEGSDGTDYICVTADAHSAWRCVYDHVAVYNIYAALNTGYKKE